jgi:hypothetical protein
VPLGLLQLLKDRDALRIGSDRFDPSLVLEYSAVPTHWVIGRQPSLPRARFIDDIRGAHLSPDLNVYRGFKPAATLDGGGRLSPAFGKTFTVRRTPRVTHQAFAGAGPYLTIQTKGPSTAPVGLLGAASPAIARRCAADRQPVHARGAVHGGYRAPSARRAEQSHRVLRGLQLPARPRYEDATSICVSRPLRRLVSTPDASLWRSIGLPPRRAGCRWDLACRDLRSRRVAVRRRRGQSPRLA